MYAMTQNKQIVILTILSIIPASASARLNPLRVATEQLTRAEIVFVLDTSGTMRAGLDPQSRGGHDCLGPRAGTVDLCGDGLCSGSEGSSGNACTADCAIASNDNTQPGSAPMCKPTQVVASRMAMVKRVMQNLIPKFKGSASFGLVTFKQTGYFEYFKQKGTNTRKVSVFLTHTEMEALGAWNNSLERPRVSFTWNGTPMTLLSSAGLTVTTDSLYMRSDDHTVEKRFSWSTAGEVHVNGGYRWRYRGSYYTYAQGGIDKKTTRTISRYMGPQFVDGTGVTWVYHRYNHDVNQGIDGLMAGMIVEPLSADQSALAQSAKTYSILTRMNGAANGGLLADGQTPTGQAIQLAGQHFAERHNGTGAFASVGADPLRGCRKRVVVLLTNGVSSSNPKTDAAVQALYNNSVFAGNPIKTIVMGLPGLPPSATGELDRAADAGDDGLFNYSTTAVYSQDERALAEVLGKVLFEVMRGDYSTTGSAVTSVPRSKLGKTMVLLPSTEYPLWRGHLRAIDVQTTPPTQLWDAGQVLSVRDYRTRKLYTGLPSTNSGAPVALLTPSGEVNVSAVRDVWAEVQTPPSNEQIEDVVKWLAGKDRAWKLGPLFRSVPAVIGRPGKRDLPGYDAFRTQHANRQRLAYVASNDGLLHAFDIRDGSETFAYVPPNLWPKIHALWLQGGQDADPRKFKWLMANSPRVEDMPGGCVPCAWKTQLVQTMGPGGADFVVLDISNPSRCNSLECTPNDPPLQVVKHSRDLGLTSYSGQSWSVPALYYKYNGASVSGRARMGSGYGSYTQGHYSNHFSSQFSARQSTLHSGDGASTDFALVASTVAVVDASKGHDVFATYQADPKGRVVRYGEENHDMMLNSKATIIGPDAANPFFYSPAVRHLGSLQVLLAAVSGSHAEEPPQTTEATLFLRSESGGTIDAGNHNMTCRVSQICSQSDSCPTQVPESCTAPTSRAVPVGSPMIIKNTPPGGQAQHEVFYLLYDPPMLCANGVTGYSSITQVDTSTITELYATKAATDLTQTTTELSEINLTAMPVGDFGTGGIPIATTTTTTAVLPAGSGDVISTRPYSTNSACTPTVNPCLQGDSYLVRLASDGASQRVLSVHRYEGVRATGLNVVGGGTDLVITYAGRGGTQASVFTLLNNVSNQMSGKGAKLESWKEVPKHTSELNSDGVTP